MRSGSSCVVGDDFVEAVDELGPEEVAQLRAVAQVRGHQDQRLREVDRATLAVGQAAVVEDLQQHVEDVGVRLLDLVEQEHAVRLAAHGLGQRATFVVTDVTRRRADHAR
jgi:peptide deformylase